MDLLLPYSLLKEHLDTDASFEQICNALTLTGPTVDRVRNLDGDQVMEIEVITNRVDAASAFGIAREATVCLPQFGHKASMKPLSVYEGEISGDNPINVQIMDQSLVSKVMAVVIKNVKVADSDKDTTELLEKMEVRAINNIVDITNELTARLGVPVHAFDFDKIKEGKVVVRESKKGEEIRLLDGSNVKLAGKDIVIEDGAGRLIDLCGVMGGELSQIDKDTSTVLLWVPIYEPKHIRRTSLYLQKRTLASQIFEKNPDKGLLDTVLRMGLKMMINRASGVVASKVWQFGEDIEIKTLNLDPARVRRVLGQEISDKEIISILDRLGFVTKVSGELLAVSIPTWRLHDIGIEEDLIEEILRIYGYFRVKPTVPSVNILELTPSKLLEYEIEAKKWLASRGFNEVMNYSLSSKKLFEEFGYTPNEIVCVNNPLSEEFEAMRPSLLPGIIRSYEENVGKTKDIWLFELSNVYVPVDGDLPDEISQLSIISNDNNYALFKGEIDLLLEKFGMDELVYKDSNKVGYLQVVEVVSKNISIGYLGILDQKLTKSKDVRKNIWVAEFDFEKMVQIGDRKNTFIPVPRYTPVRLDLTIESKTPVSQTVNKIKNTDFRILNVEYLGSFENKQTFSIEFYDAKSMLKIEDANKIAEEIIKKNY